MIGDQTPRDVLVAQLKALLDAAGGEKHERERLLHDLQVHQLELELQNRELREAQSGLEASRNRYAELYDFAPIAHFTFDVHGCVLEANLTAASLIGRDRSQLIGTPFASLIQLVDPSQFRAHLRRCGEARTHVVTELGVIDRSGGQRWLRAVTAPVTTGTDEITFRTAFLDITDRHEAEIARDRALGSERALRRELESLDHAKAALVQSLATVTEHGLHVILQTTVAQARALVDAEYAALGIGAEPGGRFEAWIHAGMAPHVAAAIGRTPRSVGTLGAVIREARTLRIANLPAHPEFAGLPPEHPPMSSFLGVPVRFGDKVLGHLYLANRRGGGEFTADDQRCIESLSTYVGMAMEIAHVGDQAREAIVSRDNLLAVVSHDLRSPLSAVTISTNLLRRLVSDAVATRQVETIGRAAARMNRLVSDLLTASTLEVGRLALAVRAERVEPIVNEARAELGVAATEAELQLDAIVPAGLPEVACDRERVLQVLANLVSNAIKFTPPGGRITIEAAHRGAEVEISVSDTGPGIPDDHLPRIFERFWRGEPGVRRGVGLGLFICHGIVETHGGRIWIDRAPGDGARVTFTLPIAKP